MEILGRRDSLVAACTGTGKAVLRRVNRQGPNRLLVVRQRRHALARGQIPQSVREIVTPAKSRRAHLTVLSMLPEIICGSDACVFTSATVLWCPVNVKMFARVRMSQTRTLASRPPVTRTSRVGWTLP